MLVIISIDDKYDLMENQQRVCMIGVDNQVEKCLLKEHEISYDIHIAVLKFFDSRFKFTQLLYVSILHQTN